MPKKSKSIKKTDIDGNKPWLKKKGITIIEEPEIDSTKTFLIVCEGQTEELYFKSFPLNSITVKCLNLGCSNFQLVDCAINLMEGEEYDQVWVVFDMDYSPSKGSIQYEQFDNSIQKAIQNNIKVAYSNDSFELWFYLHYQYTDQMHMRTFYFKELSNLWNINYEKEGKSRAFAKTIYSILDSDKRSSVENALERSEKLFEKLKVEPYHKQNPVTKVFELYLELSKE